MDTRIPQEMQQRLMQQYAFDDLSRIEAGFLSARVTSLRVNTLKSSRQEVMNALEKEGLSCEPVAWYPDALVLPADSEAALQRLPIFAEGKVYLQSLSSMLPALILQPKKGENILDMAAAPGGKTTQMAALSGNQASITACERDARRAERLRYNLKCQGAGRVTVMNQDARQLDDLFRFGKILLDAPCTGSGTLQLMREPVRRMEKAWMEKIGKTQKALLDKAIHLTGKGGEIVYSTCSILAQENEEIVRPFLQKGLVRLEAIDETLRQAVPQLPVSLPDTLCVCPGPYWEGFFVAHLRRL
ncbi:MAG: RsmB/NOP family class I SAM-dependent RNA methyltransferase [Clostridia bacterium]|nr:RsmB/NOP family class I SAM-dependent RNA methyltransferase [Clostridia bacterium]